MNNIDIIISRYNENLNWLLEKPFNEFKYIVYNKGNNDNFEKTNVKQIINIPNIGRCDHTYLYHIVENYNNLNNILVFFPGSINIPKKKIIAIQLLNRIKNNNYEKALFICRCEQNGILKLLYNFTLDKWCASDLQNKTLNNESELYLSNIRPFGKWFLHNFGNINVKYYNFLSIYSVYKKDIIKHPLFRYKKLVRQLSVSSNPEVGHYIERSWGAIFHPLIYTKIYTPLNYQI